MKITICVYVAFLMIGFSSQHGAQAGDLPFRLASAKKAQTFGLANENVSQINRLPGRGRDVVMSEVFDRFIIKKGLTAKTNEVSTEASSIVIGKDWMMEVRGTGESVRFINMGYINGSKNPSCGPKGCFSDDELEAAAIKVIQRDLANFIKLSPGEELQGWQLSRLIDSVTDSNGKITESVSAYRVLFTRVIDGVPILGPGNKVSVTFANDGTLAGFDFDWPKLELKKSNFRIAPLSMIRNDADKQMGVAWNKVQPAEEVFECGYYDPGVAGLSSGNTIAPSCVAVAKYDAGIPSRMVVIPCTVKD